MKRRVRSGVFVLLLAAAIVEVAAADECANASSKHSPTGAGEASRLGLRAYADPETGDLLSPDAVEALGAGSGGAERKQVAVVVPAPTEAGGVMVDLRGQFKHETRVHLADGKVSADCKAATSPP